MSELCQHYGERPFTWFVSLGSAHEPPDYLKLCGACRNEGMERQNVIDRRVTERRTLRPGVNVRYEDKDKGVIDLPKRLRQWGVAHPDWKGYK